MDPECVKMVPGSSQGALGTSQRGLVALLDRPNCPLGGSWGGRGTSLASFWDAWRLPRVPFWRHFVAQGRVRSEHGEQLDFDDPLKRYAYF